MKTSLGMEKRINAFMDLPRKIESARFVLHGRPHMFARWLAIWAEKNAPQFAETLSEAQIQKPSRWFVDAPIRDIPRSEVFF